MTLVRFDNISLDFGDHQLLANADFALETGERVCLIGRNGAGKTSLLRLITGEIAPDAGDIQYQTDLTIAQLDQDLPADKGLTVAEFVASGLADSQALVDRYQTLSSQADDPRTIAELETLQSQIDTHDGWNITQRVEAIVSELDLPAQRKLSELSGGWRRRVSLARALVKRPDLLLLDEPTNHLDLVSVEWLENTIRNYKGTVLFITHDRMFLQQLATRIVEIDRANLVSWPGDYANFLRRKEKSLEDEAVENARFDKRLAQEEAWIRQGIKARRTRNEGRVRALKDMRKERAKRVTVKGQAKIEIDKAKESSRRVVEARNVSYRYPSAQGKEGELLFTNLSVKIMRGDRVGLIGNNGVGKSTLLRILLGELAPVEGTVKHGNNIEQGYFDQSRQVLNLDATIADNIGEGREFITINGKDKHVISYLRGFLFNAKRAMTPVKALSGGERNRVVLAKLFSKPTNLLVLDEPTNDLDIETLDVLEEQLADYQGTVIIVSHDRRFLDNVIDRTLVFENDGQIREYPGGYSDWLRHGRALKTTDALDKVKTTTPESLTTSQSATPSKAKPAAKKKLSYKLQRELDMLPDEIEQLENQLEALQGQTTAQGFYDQPYAETEKILAEVTLVTETLEARMLRWSELEDLQG